MNNNGRALVEFLSSATEKGLMKVNTAAGLKAAVREILTAVEGGSWETVDLSAVDPDEYVRRFENLRLGKYKPGTLMVYKSRFKIALTKFADYQVNPGGWKNEAGRSRQVSRSGQPIPRRSKDQASPAVPAHVIGWHTERSHASPPTIDYPYPIRSGLVVKLTLPVDMTKTEARRLSAFLDSLAVDAPPPAEVSDHAHST